MTNEKSLRKFNIKILNKANVILGQKFSKRSEYDKLTLNDLDRDHPPACELMFSVKNRHFSENTLILQKILKELICQICQKNKFPCKHQSFRK